MRIKLLQEDSLEQQVADLRQQLDELKTAQFTSQNSGMLAHLNGAANSTPFGDIVELQGDFTGPNPTDKIPCIATPSPSHYNSIYCYQKFFTRNGRPAAVVPLVRLEVKTNGLTGKSQFILVGYRFMIQMYIYNSAGAQVGEAYMVQDLGDYLEPKYAADTDHAWQTVISYTSTVPFELSYRLLARSSDRGYTESVLEGLFF
jgi:hypothetical protein